MMDEIMRGAPYRQDSASGFHICGGIHRPWPQSVCGVCNNGPIYSPSTTLTISDLPATTFLGTLRDWFAGMALQGLLAQMTESDQKLPPPMIVAKAAYVTADAMMKARDEARQ